MVAITYHLENMRFPDVPGGLGVLDKFSAAQKPILLTIEEDDHHRADAVLADQPRAFEADGDRAGIIVCPGRAGRGIIMRTQQKKRSFSCPGRRDHNVVVVALTERCITKALGHLEQQIPGSVIGAWFGKVVAWERQRLDEASEVLRRNAAQYLR